ncbi:MAG: apolipoprotein N-acyltransferase [Candidatus Brocadiia bacterium]|nr:MAG: apolipoprotein N-acyltransferase [Candidatus Brocadiia bacterium]
MKKKNQNNLRVIFAALSASALMLTLIQPPFGLSALAWVSLVPLILISSPASSPKSLAISAYIISFFYWLANLYWIIPVTAIGWIAFCLYIALHWPIIILSIRFCRKMKIPLLIAVPIIIVGAEHLQGFFLGVFYWRFMSHSQYANTTIIQIADMLGAAGVYFMIAMVNALAAELILNIANGKKFKAPEFTKVVIATVTLTAAIAYGRWRIEQSERFVETGPMVGAIQTNIPQTVKDSPDATEEIFKNLLLENSSAASAGAELIIWPETMIQTVLDDRVLNALHPLTRGNIFDTILRDNARNRCFILAGATGGAPEIKDNNSVELCQKYNSAFLYRPDGTKSPEQYNKIHLVPFGEYVPFKKSRPWLYNILMSLTPYDYDYSLDFGTEYTVCEMAKDPNARTYKFGVMICYEDTIPAIAKNFALDPQGRKQIDWLVNISNDGWFVRFDEQNRVYPSTELAQHAAVCVFRAVENRLAVVRSVNTGISCMIDPLGRVVNGFAAGNLPSNAMSRKGISGWFADKVPIDKRVTFFSKHGQMLDISCEICLGGLIIVQLLAGVGKILFRKGRVM